MGDGPYFYTEVGLLLAYVEAKEAPTLLRQHLGQPIYQVQGTLPVGEVSVRMTSSLR